MQRLVLMVARTGFLAAFVLGVLGLLAVWTPGSGAWTVSHVLAGALFTLPLLWQAAQGGAGQASFRWAAVVALLGIATAVLAARHAVAFPPWVHLVLMLAAVALFERGVGVRRRAAGPA